MVQITPKKEWTNNHLRLVILSICIIISSLFFLFYPHNRKKMNGIVIVPVNVELPEEIMTISRDSNNPTELYGWIKQDTVFIELPDNKLKHFVLCKEIIHLH